MINQIHQGDVLEVLRSWPDAFVDCCVTSPPYWGLRDYGVEGQLGLEKTPEEYIARMVEVFREVRRVLKPEGTCWVNIGDSYNSTNGFVRNKKGESSWFRDGRIGGASDKSSFKHPDIKTKDLVGIPWMLAFALRADGWYLRQDIIWHKPNPMPESVTDRCTKSHECVFLLSKSAKYFYDAEAVKESAQTEPHSPCWASSMQDRNDRQVDNEANKREWAKDGKRNRRSVWTIATEPCPEAHFATFPKKLVEPCILAGTSEKGYCPECGKAWVRVVEKGNLVGKDRGGNYKGKENIVDAAGQNRMSGCDYKPGMSYENTTTGWSPTCTCGAEPVPGLILDPFMGSGTTALVAYENGRDFIGIELSQAYIEIAKKRLAGATRQGRLFV